MNLTEACSLLEIDRDSIGIIVTSKHVQKLYHKLALKYHPDKSGSESADRFITCKLACETVKTFLQFNEKTSNESAANSSHSFPHQTAKPSENSDADNTSNECNNEKCHSYFSPKVDKSNTTDGMSSPMDVDDSTNIEKDQACHPRAFPRLQQPSQMRAILYAVYHLIQDDFHKLFTAADIYLYLTDRDLIVKREKSEKRKATDNQFLIVHTSDSMIKKRIQNRISQYPKHFYKSGEKGKYSISQSLRELAHSLFE